MPIRAFLQAKSFNPDTIEIMNAAFVGVCNDLGLSEKTEGACEIVAKRIIELMDGECSPEELRNAVLASIKARAGRDVLTVSDRQNEATEFRRQAALCLELAEQISLRTNRDRIMEMAQHFQRLAREKDAG